MRLLRELTAGRSAVTEVRDKLADLSLAEHHRMLTDAEHTVADKTRSWRARRDAAMLVCKLSASPSEHAVEHLRRLTRDPCVANAARVRILVRLRAVDGLGRLLELRDDEGTSPAIRWWVAIWLIDRDTIDRSASAEWDRERHWLSSSTAPASRSRPGALR